MARKRVSTRLVSVAFVAAFLGSAASPAAAGPNWPEWRGPLRTGRSPTADPPLECRRQERALEARRPRPRSRQPDRLGRPRARDDRRAGRGGPQDARVRGDGGRAQGRQAAVAHGRPRGGAPRGDPPDEQLCERLAAHRRQAALRLLRVARPVRARPEGQAALGEAAREDADAQRLRRRRLARDPRRDAGRHLGPRGSRLHRGARRGDRQGALAQGPRRAHHLGDTARDRGRGRAAGGGRGDEPRRELRPRHGRGTLARLRPHDQRDPSPVYADGVVYVTSGFRGNACRRSASRTPRERSRPLPALLFRYDKDTPECNRRCSIVDSSTS